MNTLINNTIKALSLCLVLTSCEMPKLLQKTARTKEIANDNIIQKPVVAELEVKETKVTNVVTVLTKEHNVESAKELATAELLKQNKADVLVSPDYEILTNPNQITVTVYGYPATYKNFKTITANDSSWIKQSLKINSLSTTQGTNNNIQTNKPLVPKKKNGGLIAAVVLGAILFPVILLQLFK